MVTPIFTLNLKHKIFPNTVAVGKFDGKHPCLACGTTASKVFIHNPHYSAISGGRMELSESDINFLNVNQSVTALCAGRLNPSLERDILCIGSKTNLLAFDIHDNKDLFYKEVPDGVNRLIMGQVSGVDCPIVIAGGNCTLIGFDANGEDKFWTVTGDVVGALALADFTSDGTYELIVGSEDFDIRAFHFDEIIAEMSETDAITSLCSLKGNVYAYGLANGSVGLYEQAERKWRIKSKNQLVCLHGYDIDGDGVLEVIAGWSNGKVEGRSSHTGEVIFKDTMESAVAGIVDADYRLDGKSQLICCSVEGEIRGFQGDVELVKVVEDTKMEDRLRDLNLTKHNLQLELQNYEIMLRTVNADSLSHTQKLEEGAIPSDTKIQALLFYELKPKPGLRLSVSTNNKETIIKMVVVFGEGLFKGESYVMHQPPHALTQKVVIPLYPNKDIPIDLQIEALVGLPGTALYHVFSYPVALPRFSAYILTKPTLEIGDSYVTFSIEERLERIVIWFNENFIVTEEIECDNCINIRFLAIRGGEFTFKMEQSGHVFIYTDSMDLAGDLIQSLATYLRLEHLQVTAYFPALLKKMKSIVNSVENLYTVTQRLAAEMTDHSNLIKSLVVHAEDARLQDDFAGMRKGYMELFDLNRDLTSGYHVRSTNHEELVKSLKLVNQMIQKASHLRVGKYQTQVVSQCREAIRKNKIGTILKIIRAGSA